MEKCTLCTYKILHVSYSANIISSSFTLQPCYIIMNTAFFLARKMRYSGNFSAVVIKIAGVSISLGVAILIMAFGILQGFRSSIHEKIFSFGGHLTVRQYSAQSFYEEAPISVTDSAYSQLQHSPLVAHVQQFSLKPALMRSEQEVQGIMIKGIDADFNFDFFSKNMVKGRFPALSSTTSTEEVVMSERLASLLGIDVGQEVVLFFVQNPPRFRKALVSGLFKTHLEEFDNGLVLAPMRMVRELNGWKDQESGGFEVFIKDFNHFDQVAEQIEAELPFYLGVDKITDLQRQIFEWLNMIGRNVDIMLVLICLVAAFNMVSTLLIMILERTQTVGILKAMGATDAQIQQLFWVNGAILTAKGIFWGNVVGIGLCFIQQHFQIIKLNPESYYMEYVPIAWNWGYILLVNVASLAGIGISLLLPTLVILSIKPATAVRFN